MARVLLGVSGGIAAYKALEVVRLATKAGHAVRVFIAPPSREALRARLVGRGTDDPQEVTARLQAAETELAAQDEFAHVVVNDRLEDAVDELTAIVRGALRDAG